MDFLPALGGIENDAADFRTGHGLDAEIADLVEVLPGCVFGRAGSDEFDDCAVGGLDVDVLSRGVVDGCEGRVGMSWSVGQF